MPLIKSTSKKALGENIGREIDAGRPKKQAAAIAYSVQREAKKREDRRDARRDDKKEARKDDRKHEKKQTRTDRRHEALGELRAHEKADLALKKKLEGQLRSLDKKLKSARKK